MVDQKQARDVNGQALYPGQWVEILDRRDRAGWPLRISQYIGQQFVIRSIKNECDRHWGDWVVWISESAESDTHGVLAEWLRVPSIGLKGLAQRYRGEVVHG